MDNSRCSCGSRDGSADCCAPILAGAAAPTAERLMRSRYSAFRLGDVAHLQRSWHPDTLPTDLELDDTTRWRALQIVAIDAGSESDVTGTVEFRASYRGPEGVGLLHERSRFVRHEGRWVYRDGDILDE